MKIESDSSDDTQTMRSFVNQSLEDQTRITMKLDWERKLRAKSGDIAERYGELLKSEKVEDRLAKEKAEAILDEIKKNFTTVRFFHCIPCARLDRKDSYAQSSNSSNSEYHLCNGCAKVLRAACARVSNY